MIKYWLYDNDKENTVRYTLGEIMDIGDRTFATIGINPSTAEPDNLDNTLVLVRKKAIKENFINWIMFNLYPKRATQFNELEISVNQEIYKKNIDMICNTIKHYGINKIWCAWGGMVIRRKYLIQAIKDIINKLEKEKFYEEIIFLRANYNIKENNHPHHPLYLPSDTELIKFDIKEYMIKLGG